MRGTGEAFLVWMGVGVIGIALLAWDFGNGFGAIQPSEVVVTSASTASSFCFCQV